LNTSEVVAALGMKRSICLYRNMSMWDFYRVMFVRFWTDDFGSGQGTAKSAG
jgi:hypothetical protein